MKRQRSRIILILLCVAVLGSSAVALAQFYGQVRVQLDTIEVVVKDFDFQRTHAYTLDTLRRGQSDSFNVTLQRGWTYAIASVCDEDCDDIDISLYDENGRIIDVDESSTDYPIVKVTPRWTGRFTVRVKMYSCHATDCVYGIGIFGR